MPTRKKKVQRRMQVVTRAMEAAKAAAKQAAQEVATLLSSDEEDAEAGADAGEEEVLTTDEEMEDFGESGLDDDLDEEEEEDEEEDDDDDDASYSSEDSWESIADDHSFFMPRGPKDWKVDKYTIVKRLQRGGFASVFKAQHNQSGKACALKVYSIDTEDTIERELSILMAIRHNNVMTVSRLREFASKSTGCTYRYVSMPLYPKDLTNYIYDVDEKDTFVRTEEHFNNIMLQICAGLSAVHAVCHAHGDVKPENVLINDESPENVKVCLCDFGSAYDLSGNEKAHDGYGHTLAFAAPEVVTNDFDLISYSVDVFALACLYVELISEQPLFPEKEDDMLHLAYVQALDGGKPFPPSIVQNRLYFTRFGKLHENAERRAAALPAWEEHCGLSEAQVAFVKSCCQLDPEARPTLDAAIAWFVSQEKEVEEEEKAPE